MDAPDIHKMSEGKPISFKIDKKKRGDCKYLRRTIKIVKTRAMQPGSPIKYIADNKVGVIQCSKGQVDYMSVIDEAKDCGLETHLIRLCLSDLDLNINILNADVDVAAQNKGVEHLANQLEPTEDKDAYKARIQWIQKNCIHFWVMNLYSKDPSYGDFLFDDRRGTKLPDPPKRMGSIYQVRHLYQADFFKENLNFCYYICCQFFLL